MADKFIEIDVEDEKDIILGLERQAERQRKILREMIVDLSNVASLTLISLVPQYHSYLMNHIDREGPTWMPGGPGGGGEWRGIVGIKEGTSRHALYAEFGTGIYAGRGLIWAGGVKGLTGSRQPVMAFKKRGEGGGKWIVRYWTRGQKGQHYFYRTWGIVNAIAQGRILTRSLYE